jgi:hypothetical protein
MSTSITNASKEDLSLRHARSMVLMGGTIYSASTPLIVKNFHGLEE